MLRFHLMSQQFIRQLYDKRSPFLRAHRAHSIRSGRGGDSSGGPYYSMA